ncbi:MAG: alpha/beta hydrolase [Terracidiphilus sp.]
MDFEYFAAPAVLSLICIMIGWLSVRHLRSLPAKLSSRAFRAFDRLILFAMIFGSAVLAVSAGYNAVALFRFREFNQPPGQFYLVNGHRMRLDCVGSGSPAIVLDSGLGSDALVWGGVQPQLAKTTRVCSYDRAGFGWSDSVPGPRDADHIAAELHQLLTEANVSRPIVLMGHSIAALYIRDYAAHYPEDVAGLIFVDGSTPLQDENPALKAAGETGMARRTSILLMRTAAMTGISRLMGGCAKPIPGFDASATSQLLSEDLCHPRYTSIERELDSFNASGHETIHTGPFGALPVLIFSQDPSATLSWRFVPHEMAGMESAWGQMQEDLKKLSTRSRRIIARNSGHAVEIDRSDLIRKEVPLFIEQIRGVAPEPASYGSTVTE